MDQNKTKTKILFVCLGNICRSPSAEGIMKKIVKREGLESSFHIDSAGILNYHQGELPDSRMRSHAARRGYDLNSRSRPIQYDDFFEFDMIIGMDDNNIMDLKRLSPDTTALPKISRMTDYSLRLKQHNHVPDPYYSGAEGFELVLDILEDACEGLLERCKEMRAAEFP